jgi:hypothetical protein
VLVYSFQTIKHRWLSEFHRHHLQEQRQQEMYVVLSLSIFIRKYTIANWCKKKRFFIPEHQFEFVQGQLILVLDKTTISIRTYKIYFNTNSPLFLEMVWVVVNLKLPKTLLAVLEC